MVTRRSLIAGAVALGLASILPAPSTRALENRRVVMTISPQSIGDMRYCNYVWIGQPEGRDLPIKSATYFYDTPLLKSPFTVPAEDWLRHGDVRRIPTVNELLMEEQLRADTMVQRPEAILPHKIIIEY